MLISISIDCNDKWIENSVPRLFKICHDCASISERYALNIDMRAHEFITETTTAGGIAPVAMPMGGVIKREVDEDLKKWFREKWVRFGPDGKIRGDCARGSESEGKPKCLPQSKAHALGKKGRASAAARKRREDPNPERKGAARNVATKKKS